MDKDWMGAELSAEPLKMGGILVREDEESDPRKRLGAIMATGFHLFFADDSLHGIMAAMHPPRVTSVQSAMARRYYTFRKWARSAGWHPAIVLACVWVMRRAGLQRLRFRVRTKPRQVKHPVTARIAFSSDADCFCQVFVDGQYSDIGDIGSPRFILDLGANVGYASALFLSRFPSAKVLAAEPDPDNFEICRHNLMPYGKRATVLRCAVWSRPSHLVLSRSFGDGREWAIQVREFAEGDNEATVEGWDVRSLLDMAGEEYVDLMKIDIERGELEVFGSRCAPWLRRVRNICIELHGPDCERVFLEALRDYEYELSTTGELTICTNLRPKSQGDGATVGRDFLPSV